MNAVMQAAAAGDQAALTAALRADLRRNMANIPDALKQRKAWLVWQASHLNPERGKFGKVPFYPRSRMRRHGQQGSAEDRAALGTFDDAIATFEADERFAGLGLAMTPESGLVALDADHCVTDANGNPVVASHVTDLLAGTYAELSPSGSGVRAFWWGEAKGGKNHDAGLELFHQNGFVTVTGNRLAGDEPRPLTLPLAQRLQSLVTASPSAGSSPPTELATLTRQAFAPRPDMAELREALFAIPADDRDLWVRMGHALKTLGEAANGLWHDWSATSPKYEPGDAEHVWQSFQPMQTNSGAIFAEAKRHGWSGNLPASIPATGAHPVRLDLAALPLNPPPVPFIIPGWLPAGVVTLFAAHGGSGKSYIALWIALCLAIGRHPFEQGCTLPRQKVLLYSAEDGLPVLQWRIRQYVNLLGVDPAALDDWLTVLDATASENALFRAGREGGSTTPRYDWLADEVGRTGADLLIFDNASDAMDANENDRASVKQFMSALRTVAPTVLLLAHVDAASSMANRGEALKGYSGSTAWHNSARSRWFLAKDADGTLSLTQPKVNYGRPGSQVFWAWDDERKVFIVTGSFAQAPSGEAYRPQLLELLAKALDEGQTISPHANANNNAGKVIMSMPGYPARLGKGELRKEIEAWQRLGLVSTESYRTPGRKLSERLALTRAGRGVAAGEDSPEPGNAKWSEDEF